jgi:hypothetical protein
MWVVIGGMSIGYPPGTITLKLVNTSLKANGDLNTP